MTPKPIRLPFNSIPKGTFDSAFPGVESQARMALPPRNPVTNTAVSDAMVKLGSQTPSAAPTSTTQQPTGILLAAQQPRAAAPMKMQLPARNPLGGMDSRPLSERGSAGPMSYAPRGVGTNNPNAFAVGQNNKGFSRRVGNEMSLPDTGMPMMPAANMAPDIRGLMPTPAKPTPMQLPGRDEAFFDQMSQDAAAFSNEPTAAQPGMEIPQTPELFAMEGAGGYVPMMRNPDGSTKAAGGFYPGPAPAPFSLPTLPASPEAQAQAIAKQAQQQEAMFRSQGMVPTLPKQATDAAGRSYAPATSTAEQPFKGLIRTEGGEETMDKATGKMIKTPVREYTVMQDASGKLVKRYIQDENGDGVPDAQAKEKSAPSWLDWLNSQAK